MRSAHNRSRDPKTIEWFDGVHYALSLLTIRVNNFKRCPSRCKICLGRIISIRLAK